MSQREVFCDTHGMFHFMPGDPDCEFVDGFGNAVDPTEDDE
jgi:hypothetical protein